MTLSLVQPGGHAIALAGAVGPGDVIALHRAAHAAVSAGHRTIVVDLSAVTLLGGQTAGLFAGALRRLACRRVTLQLRGGPPHLQRTITAHAGTPRDTRGLQLLPGARCALIADGSHNTAADDHLATAGTAA